MLRMALASAISVMAIHSAEATPAPDPFPVTQVSDRLFVIHGGRGYGSHVGVCVGDVGLLLVDTMLERSLPRLKETLSLISDKPVKLIINTHGHTDHTGGNAHFAEAGALIIGDEDTVYSGALVHLRSQGGFSIEFCEETITAHAVEAHTYGDLILKFSTSNTLFMGDTFANTYFPSGYAKGRASEAQTIQFAESISDENTVIVPGHGQLDDRLGLDRYSRHVERWFDRVGALHFQALTIEDMLADPEIQTLGRIFLGAEHTFVDPEVRLERFLRRTISSEFFVRKAINPARLEKITGTYVSDDGDEISLRPCDEALCLTQLGAFKEELIPIGANSFQIRGSLEGSAEVSFDDPEGQVELLIQTGEFTWRGSKPP